MNEYLRQADVTTFYTMAYVLQNGSVNVSSTWEGQLQYIRC